MTGVQTCALPICFHAYLQRNNVAFESALAKSKNIQAFKHIREGLDDANLQLGKERGEAPDCAGTGKRFAHVMAIAPNASSSILMGNTSPSVEPYRANAYRQDTLSGSYLNKNKYLDDLIKKHCEENTKADYQEVWSSIIANDGSVQHLDWMDEWSRDVFKTSMEDRPHSKGGMTLRPGEENVRNHHRESGYREGARAVQLGASKERNGRHGSHVRWMRNQPAEDAEQNP